MCTACGCTCVCLHATSAMLTSAMCRCHALPRAWSQLHAAEKLSRLCVRGRVRAASMILGATGGAGVCCGMACYEEAVECTASTLDAHMHAGACLACNTASAVHHRHTHAGTHREMKSNPCTCELQSRTSPSGRGHAHVHCHSCLCVSSASSARYVMTPDVVKIFADPPVPL